MHNFIRRFARSVVMASTLGCAPSLFAAAPADFACTYAGGIELVCTETNTLTQVRVPLYSEAYDQSRVDRLARAVLCGGATDCRVRFNDAPAALAGLDPLALVDQTDAALID